MRPINYDSIPQAMRDLNQWILWRLVERDGKATKLPFQTDGKAAKSNDKTTWDTLANVRQFDWQYTGIGFVFSADDPFVGIDLDGCRDPQTGQVSDWAREIILKFSAYAEVSPSETGVKIFCRGKSPFASGRKIEVVADPVCGKMPAIEVYDRGRYFAVTGWILKGQTEPHERQEAIDWLKETYFADEPAKPIQDFRGADAVIDRARKYIAKLPAAISGQSGHKATFHAACVLVCGFELAESDALDVMREYNQRCVPAWSDRELVHKVKSAFSQPGQRGYLRNSRPENWSKISVPTYEAPKEKHEAKRESITLIDASRQYLESVKNGKSNLVSTSIFDLDYAIGGGLEFGEMVIFAARPSHGKSAVALQCVHGWTLGNECMDRMPCCIVSEEMSPMMLGRRTMQFLSAMPQEHWKEHAELIAEQLDKRERIAAPCFVETNCRTAEKAAEAISKRVREDGVRCAVIDYAQLLQSPGRGRYEQITNTSITLRQLANETKIVLLVLCQLNRQIESRGGNPTLADLKDSGQLEQDADVIAFLVWPHRNDATEQKSKYQFHIGKVRNRMRNELLVTCSFDPSRQMVRDAMPNEFAETELEAMR